MNLNSHKLGFWSVFALVIGSQVGSAIFLLPATLAPYGFLGVLGWIGAGCGAIALAVVFATLCNRYPKTGGPHVYVEQAFGKLPAFFTGWTYWVISWVGTTVVVVASVGYLSPFIGAQHPVVYFALETVLLFCIVLVNLRGVQLAGHVEFTLALLKTIPLILIPFCALWFFNPNNFVVQEPSTTADLFRLLGRTMLLTLWGFIGLESATAPAGSVKNPSKTIPRAIVLGTLTVVMVYVFNSIAIMGLIPGNVLMYSKAPYVDAAQLIFGGSWYFIISIMTALVCISNLNAWTLISGQIALGLAEDRFFPGIFARKNRYDAPKWGLIVSSAGVVPLLFFTMHENMAYQISTIIDFSVTAFLFIYLVSAIGFLTLLIQQKEPVPFYQWFAGCIAIIFCSWIIYTTPLATLGIATLFVISGLPLYLWYWRRRG